MQQKIQLTYQEVWQAVWGKQGNLFKSPHARYDSDDKAPLELNHCHNDIDWITSQLEVPRH
ncbi:hypothetical protein [Paraburkholderia youngii]|uniref:hypothetical protein n=1 Tax=Paraburkholderia youngii TaxID=2782701 RepID=UPI0015907563|nr:hypothetical protein [Paraburkholderia youngii]NUX54845.1 hypothetical protein [Paraburkholderia youngii]